MCYTENFNVVWYFPSICLKYHKTNSICKLILPYIFENHINMNMSLNVVISFKFYAELL